MGDRERSSPSASVVGEAVGSFEAGSDLHSFCFRKTTVATAENLGSQGRKGGTVRDCFRSTRELPQLGSGGRCGGEEQCQVLGVLG